MISDTFFDDTIGILVTEITRHEGRLPSFRYRALEGATSNSARWRAVREAKIRGGCNYQETHFVLGPDPDNDPGEPFQGVTELVHTGHAIYKDRNDDSPRRRAVLQWHPADAVMITLDDNFVNP